jgi:hypothetical protein
MKRGGGGGGGGVHSLAIIHQYFRQESFVTCVLQHTIAGESEGDLPSFCCCCCAIFPTSNSGGSIL